MLKGDLREQGYDKAQFADPVYVMKNSEETYSDLDDDYLSKYKIYCLINKGQKEEAQLILDLKKELGFQDNYYENKINET